MTKKKENIVTTKNKDYNWTYPSTKLLEIQLVFATHVYYIYH